MVERGAADLERAVEVAVTAFCKGRSRTYPYVPNRVDRLWIMQDDPPRKNPRKVEIMGCAVDPDEVSRTLRKASVGWHFYVDIVSTEVSLLERKKLFKAAGYRALGTEWVFVHDLRVIPEATSDPPVRLVQHQEQFRNLPQVAAQKRPYYPDVRQYCIWDERRTYGWVFSRPVGPDAWTGDLYVHEHVRGRGYGFALMARLLNDDRRQGIRSNVLIASKAGARLYPHLGYQLIGALQLFCPQPSARSHR